ncbi:hypothetical protein TSUD_138630 [Trifolium subterraneum]|uniref:Reverse transcriptase zinc-binding domain-containing protein n=1 Tax=Trifolium subterraneum TaxID=3900 RepID=A0A2Z6MUW5_TRISU|nr:hypothetical protein TSUD_138630 [Trifolium subterraneum]
MSRLDRFLLSEEWCLAWPNCVQVAKMRGLSDHCPLVLSANEEDWGPRPSRMIKCWKDIPGYKFLYKISGVLFGLKVGGGEEEQLSEAELVELHGVTSDIHSFSRLHTSICWQQSRSRWLKEGDANSKYFHSVLANRRRGNAISSIQEGGVTLEGVNPIRQVVVSHFASHFKAVNVDRPGIYNLVFQRLSLVESRSLTLPFSTAEVKVVCGIVIAIRVQFHRNGKLTKCLNSTFIALIPKIDSPQQLNDFRPISLVGCLYKILAKVLANRLRLVMGSVISKSQTAFVKDRQILDGILIANEAYDSVDWGYLDDIMGRMAFPTLWRKWIKECIAAEGLHVLMEAVVERKSANVRALRAVLVLFESMSGIKINFNKSMLVGVNIPESWLCEAASSLCCRVGKIPFLYLGLPIGGDLRRLGFWEPLLARLKNRLSGWKSRFLSFGGRLTLLKSVLTSLPVYALSFFKAPSSTISSIESLLIKFFWGGGEDSRKTSWINWKTICLRKEYGGLGVRQLKEFNLALLGKWCWRMLVDREGLWFRVLTARYGVERGRLRVGGRRGSSWWREIVNIRDGGGGLGGGWFREHVLKKVGDGSDTFFWTDPWEEGIPLCERFGRLFDMEENKSVSVAEMFALGWGEGGEALIFQIGLWQPDPGIGYTVRDTYQLLTSQDTITLDAAEDLIWHSQVPLKVSVLVWRLLQDRLPTKSNLVARGILSLEAHHCVSGCGTVESTQHLFLSCSMFGSLWSLVSSWIGSSLVEAQTLSDHFVQFTSSAGGSRARRSFMQLVLLACVWVVWSERNHRLFRGSTNSLITCWTRSRSHLIGG